MENLPGGERFRVFGEFIVPHLNRNTQRTIEDMPHSKACTTSSPMYN